MSGRFEGRTAVVTAAASGIGRAIVERYVADGGVVVAGDIDEAGLAALRSDLGAAVTTRRCDVTVSGDVAELVAAGAGGHLDAMFNVAGGQRPAPLVEMSEADWDFTVALCLKSAFLGTRLAARAFLAAGVPGAVVNIASLNSRVPMGMGGAYSAAKAGVVSLTETAAIELGERGIRVNAVSPGLTDTPLVSPLLTVPAVRAAYLERIPMRRAATPAEIASAATFLASDDAAYINGVNLFVDGGWEHTAYPDLAKAMGAG